MVVTTARPLYRIIIASMVLDIVNAAGMYEAYGTYVDDEYFGIHDYDDDIDHDSDDETDNDTNYDTVYDTDDGGRGNRRPLPGGDEFIS